ncbi:glycosyltransferase family 4 protein [Crenothrix sp.]|uniref:glycosyltransferase family 4 protein n=1 Tax=Crenothrix sp. TaxID=3100433 RepID=UPI00374DD4B7
MIEKEQVKIAFCENGKGFGGAAISLQTYLSARSSWVKPLIITGQAEGEYVCYKDFGTWETIVQPRNFNALAKDLLGKPIGSMADNLFNIVPTALKFARLFVKHRIDLVYLNNDVYSNLAAALGAYLVRKPVMLHLRGFCEISPSSCWVVRHLRHLAYVSEAIKHNALEFGIPEQQMTWIPEGINTDYFAKGNANNIRHSLSINTENLVVTLVGGLVGWKGQDILITAAPAILDRYPNTIFLLVGSAYGHFNTIENQLLELIKELNLKNKVLMLGKRNDIADILAISDVVVHASTLPEPLGRTVVEGMAAGKAVIAANEGGPLDVITHGMDGLLITPRDPQGLAHTICELLDNFELRQQLGAEAIKSAQKYSVDNHVRCVEAAIIKALEAK